MNTAVETVRLLISSPAHYTTRLARNADDIRAAQVLRFEVFNLELNEGLAASHATGRDEDPFDSVCDHLLVEHRPSGRAVGTYRLQTGLNAAAHRGYYCEQEFEFNTFEPARAEIIELGRACVDREHRNLIVLGLLWKGIADYARERRGLRLFSQPTRIRASQNPEAASRLSGSWRKNLRPTGAGSRLQNDRLPDHAGPRNTASPRAPAFLRMNS